MTQHQVKDKITLTVAGSNGEFTEDFPANMPVHAFKVKAMAQLHMNPSEADRFCLMASGVKLDESKTLGELGLVDGTVIALEPCEVVQI